MKIYKSFTINQLFQLLEDRPYHQPKVKHKGKIKSFMKIKKDGDIFKVTLKVANSYTYKMKPDDIMELDINHEDSRFKLTHIWSTFGASQKFRCRDWNVGHYGTMMGPDSILDTARGQRSRSSLPAYVMLYDEVRDIQIQVVRETRLANFIANPLDNITCGFELETQKTMGHTRIELDRVPLVSASTTTPTEPDLSVVGLLRWIRCGLPEAHDDWNTAAVKGLGDFNNWLSDNNINNFEDAISQGYLTSVSTASVARRWTQENAVTVEGSSNGNRRAHIQSWNLPSNIEVVSDGSVSGHEFRTIGAPNSAEFQSALVGVFKLDHDIDRRCSFHIHLKVKDMKHEYNRGQRQTIIQYLFANAHRLPEDVRSRWADSEANYFFMPDNGEDKFNFIHFHHLGTLEFRCFGNIQNVKDGMICLQLAIEALAHSMTIHDDIPVETADWGSEAREAMQQGSVSELAAFAAAHEDYRKFAAENKAIIKTIEPTLLTLNRSMFQYNPDATITSTFTIATPLTLSM